MTTRSFSIHVRTLLGILTIVAIGAMASSSTRTAIAQNPQPLTPLATTQPADATPSSAPNSGAANSTEATGSATKTTTTTGDPEPRREPDPTAVLRELTNKQNAAPRPVVLPNRPNQIRTTVMAPEAIPANAIRPVSTRLLPDGYRLVDRTGRLTREGDYYVFAFESRSEGEAEAPIRLLPNRLLEDMEDFSEGGARPVVFIVSGEITEYHGVNYLLLQKLLTRPNLGNLK